METRFTRGKSAILERSLARLFSEMVQYCQSQVYSASDTSVKAWGASLLDVLVLREECKRETKVLNILLFIKQRLDLHFKRPGLRHKHKHKQTTFWCHEILGVVGGIRRREQGSVDCQFILQCTKRSRQHTGPAQTQDQNSPENTHTKNHHTTE
uniref:Uncharacterized protein n=1 Tax=Oncorhynchus mykiss TaxID=8022 RepID=A0A8C7Q3Z2_ONCMY